MHPFTILNFNLNSRGSLWLHLIKILLALISENLNFFTAVNEQKGVIKFDNSCVGWKQFYQKFSNILPNSMVILEATGGYELGLLYFLIDRNIAVHRANTRQVKNFILSHGTLAKTDSLDAKALAQYGSERCGSVVDICSYLHLSQKNKPPCLHFVSVVTILRKCLFKRRIG